MSIFQVLALALMLLFYGCYGLKMLNQRSHGIKTDHMGEGKVAVDDYGAGHSNIVNLLRYTPHIIKIDRFLITNIQNDPNKQMFVKSTIEFARLNNIKVLAEGVETYEEMKTVIEYGIDMIQGFYTAKPAPEPLRTIPEKILREIIDENITASRYDNELLAYNAADGETVLPLSQREAAGAGCSAAAAAAGSPALSEALMSFAGPFLGETP